MSTDEALGGTSPERTVCLGQHQAKREDGGQQAQVYGDWGISPKLALERQTESCCCILRKNCMHSQAHLYQNSSHSGGGIY